MKLRPLLCLITVALLGSAPTGSAHRLDEYLQAATIGFSTSVSVLGLHCPVTVLWKPCSSTPKRARADAVSSTSRFTPMKKAFFLASAFRSGAPDAPTSNVLSDIVAHQGRSRMAV